MSLILSKKIYDLKEIPNETGIYYFIDSLNIPIYIGKSLDLNKRISQHLNSKSRKSEKIKMRYDHIRYLITRSELIALLIESQEIKKNTPILNRKLRKKKRAVHVSKYIKDNGLFGLKITRDIKNSISSFRSTKSAKSFLEFVSEKYGLCQKLNHVISGSHCCFSISSKSKSKKCLTEESQIVYNSKFNKMIKSLTLPKKNFTIFNKKHNKPYPFVSVKNGVVEGYGFTNNKSSFSTKIQKKLDYVTKDETIIVKNYYNRNYSDLEIKVL